MKILLTLLLCLLILSLPNALKSQDSTNTTQISNIDLLLNDSTSQNNFEELPKDTVEKNKRLSMNIGFAFSKEHSFSYNVMIRAWFLGVGAAKNGSSNYEYSNKGYDFYLFGNLQNNISFYFGIGFYSETTRYVSWYSKTSKVIAKSVGLQIYPVKSLSVGIGIHSALGITTSIGVSSKF